MNDYALPIMVAVVIVGLALRVLFFAHDHESK